MNRAEFEKQFQSALKGRSIPDDILQDITAPTHKDNYILHFDLLEELKEDYTGDEIKQLVYAWKDYVESGVIPELKDRGLRQAWQRGRDQIDRDIASYMRTTIKNRIIAYFRDKQNDTTGNEWPPVVTSDNRYKDIGYKDNRIKGFNDYMGLEDSKDVSDHNPPETQTKPKQNPIKTQPTLEAIREHFRVKQFKSDPDGFYAAKKNFRTFPEHWQEWAEDWEHSKPRTVKSDLSPEMRHNYDIKALARAAKE